MRTHITFVVVFGLLLGSMFMAFADFDEKVPLDIRIAKIGASPTIRVGSDNPRAGLHVVVTNISNNTIRIWDQWNSWGYRNLTLSLKFKDGDEQNVKLERLRPMFGWYANAPVAIELLPDECYVFSVWLTSKDAKRTTTGPGNAWGPVPIGRGEALGATLQAHYEIAEERGAARELGVWVGRTSSEPILLGLRGDWVAE